MDQNQESENEDEGSQRSGAEPEGDEDIERDFKNLRWTRVIALQDYKE